ncbi:hypothetical protein WJX73_006015 [Symbiochloris irregularis]|uniref:J domain-containing protein n=1 Tax=Symbiochloris irregularis TaxID=706552 RepID=A0AAW1PZ15_9CHLO
MLLSPQPGRLSGCALRQAYGGKVQRLRKRKRFSAVKAIAAEDDPWQTLGVSKDADDKTVKKAYRKLALRSHPDLNKDPGAAATFLRIQGAYETLSGRRRGKSIDQPSKRGGWDFHDWYWQFSASRKWEKNHPRGTRLMLRHRFMQRRQERDTHQHSPRTSGLRLQSSR